MAPCIREDTANKSRFLLLIWVTIIIIVYISRITNYTITGNHQIPAMPCMNLKVDTTEMSPQSQIILQELYSLNPSQNGNDIYLLWPVDSNIKARPLCAAESWALHHPSRTVWFILTSTVAEDSDNVLQKLLSHHPNLHFAYVNIENLFDGTPFQDIFSSNRWKKGTTFAEVNLSDLIRLLLISKTGGMYVDTDAIVMKNIDEFGHFVGVPRYDGLTNNMFSFNRTSPFLKALISYISKNFKSNNYGWNGPKAMTATGNLLCGKDFLKPLQDGSYHPCLGLNFPPTKAFYPIDFPSYEEYFKEGEGASADKILNESYAIHLFNKFSRHITTHFGSQSIFDIVARSNCPVIYNSMKIRSDHF